MSSYAIDPSIVVVVAAVVLASMAFYVLSARLGRAAHGTGDKYAPFTGGEEIPPARGKYHSELFVYAALFTAFEVFALLLAAAVGARSMLLPILFTAAGGLGLSVIIVWFVATGGSKLA